MSTPIMNTSSQEFAEPIIIDDENVFDNETTTPTSNISSNRVNEAKISETFFQEKKGDYRSCKTCGDSIKQLRSNKTSLVNHMKMKHADAWRAAIRTVQSGSSHSVTPTSGQTTLNDGVFGIVIQANFDEAMLRWIIKDQQSYAVIEHPDFRAMIGVANKRIDFISADTVSRRIIDKHLKYEKILQTKIEAIPSKFN
jgi:hypothetical protein